MTLIKKHQEFQATSGETLFMEQYHEKHWREGVWMWRYGVIVKDSQFEHDTQVWSDFLWSRPNKKRLIDKY